MATTATNTDLRRDALNARLLDYLLNCRPWYPGSDGMTCDAVLSIYSQAAGYGLVPTRQELEERFPEWRDEVAEFFSVST